MRDPNLVSHRIIGAGSAKTSSGGLGHARAASLLGNWRLTPATLMAHLDEGWIPAPWLQYLSLKIAQCVARGNSGLLISAPPRHGKSQLSTIATPLWVLENFPDKSVVVATYGEELSTDFTRQIRDHIQQNQAELNVRLRQDARRVTNILTTEGGGLKAVGLQGTITGRGADVLIIDDYIKNPKEALSSTYLDDLWDWWRTVARTRLEPGAVVIILATRWVANDLHGRIMKQQAETGRTFFDYIQLPAIYEAPLIADPSGAVDEEGEPEMVPDPSARDEIGRSHGEVLFPGRYNTKTIYDIRTELGTRWFNAMFQQKPDGDEGKIVDTAWFQKITHGEFRRRYERMLESRPGQLTWGRCWDLASTAEAGDFTAGPLALHDKETDHFYMVEMARGQWSSHRVEAEFLKAVTRDVNMCWGDTVKYKSAIEREPGSSGVYTINHFQKILRESDDSLVRKVLVSDNPATKAKLLNAQPLLAAAESGKVFVVADYDEFGATIGWVKTFFEELESFPGGEHDDQVDGASLAYKTLTGKSFVKPVFGRGEEELPKARRGTGVGAVEPKEIADRRRIGITFGRRR